MNWLECENAIWECINTRYNKQTQEKFDRAVREMREKFGTEITQKYLRYLLNEKIRELPDILRKNYKKNSAYVRIQRLISNSKVIARSRYVEKFIYIEHGEAKELARATRKTTIVEFKNVNGEIISKQKIIIVHERRERRRIHKKLHRLNLCKCHLRMKREILNVLADYYAFLQKKWIKKLAKSKNKNVMKLLREWNRQKREREILQNTQRYLRYIDQHFSL